jgi:hypothetical protein
VQPLVSPACFTFGGLGTAGALRYGADDPVQPGEIVGSNVTLGAPDSANHDNAPLFIATTLGYCFYYPSYRGNGAAGAVTLSPTCLQLGLNGASVTAVAHSPANHCFFVATDAGEIYIVAVRSRPTSLRARKMETSLSTVVTFVKSTLGATLGSIFRAPSPVSGARPDDAIVKLFALRNSYEFKAGRNSPNDAKRMRLDSAGTGGATDAAMEEDDDADSDGDHVSAIAALTAGSVLQFWSINTVDNATCEALQASIDVATLVAHPISMHLKIAKIHLQELKLIASAVTTGCDGREYLITISSCRHPSDPVFLYYATLFKFTRNYALTLVTLSETQKPICTMPESHDAAVLLPSPTIDVGIPCYLSFPRNNLVISFNLAISSSEHNQSSIDFNCTLPSNVCGSIIGGGTGVIMDGGVRLLTTTGCVLSLEAKFEKSDILVGGSGNAGGNAENIDHITDVIVKSFGKFVEMNDNNTYSSEGIVRSVESLRQVSSSSIDQAVSRASEFLLGPGDSQTSSGQGHIQQTTSDALKQMLINHMSFVSFLRCAGIFSRLTTSRLTLASHGEMIHSSKELCDLRNDFIRANEVAQVRDEHIVDSLRVALKDVQNDVTSIIEQMTHFQTRSTVAAEDYNADSAESSNILRGATTAIVLFVSAALKRRSEFSEVYETQSAASTWTDRSVVRRLLFNQLTVLNNRPEYVRKVEDSMLTHTMSLFLLDSYKATRIRSDAEEAEYTQSKKTCVDLLRRMVSDDDATALNVAVTYSHWSGICEICTGVGNASQWGLEKLAEMVAEPDGDAEFPAFALRWLGEHDLLAEALNIGRSCPTALAAYLQTPAASRLKWMNDTRSSEFGNASESLLAVAGGKKTLKERKNAYSLALIAAEADGSAAWSTDERAAMGLVSVCAQEVLQQGVATAGTPAMDDWELCNMACVVLEEGAEDDTERAVEVAMVALDVAARMKNRNSGGDSAESERGEANARAIWEATVKVERGLWELMASRMQSSTDDAIKAEIRKSKLYRALCKYLVLHRGEGELGLQGGGSEQERARILLAGFKDGDVERVLGIAIGLAYEEAGAGGGNEGNEGNAMLIDQQ